MKASINQHFNLKLTTVTPLSIGGNTSKTFSPYSDYFISKDGQLANLIDHGLVEAALSKKKDLIRDYVQDIHNGFENNRSDASIVEFCENKLGLKREEIIKKSIPNIGIEASQRIVVQPMAKSGTKAFLPGSTLKGAFRSVLIFEWLMKLPKGKRIGEEIYLDINNDGYELKEELISLLAKGNQVDKRRKQRLFRDIDNFWKKLLNEKDLFVGEVYNYKNERGRRRSHEVDFARFFRFYDSNKLEDAAVFLQTKRYNLFDGKEAEGDEMNICKEAIGTGISFKTQLYLQDIPFAENGIEQLISKDETQFKKDFFTYSSSYFKTIIRFEIMLLEKAKDTNTTLELLDFYRDLLSQFDEQTTFWWLGGGKTFFANTIFLTMLDFSDDGEVEIEMNEVLEIYHQLLFKKELEQLPIPKTRTLTPDNKPLGWVKVEVV